MITYADILDGVARTVYSYGQSFGVTASRDQIRAAVVASYNELPVIAPWRRYISTARFSIQSPVTASATKSGSTLTLDSGTWPSWAAGNTVQLGSYWRRIESASGSIATLEDSSGSDGSYNAVLRNDAFALPSDFLVAVSASLESPNVVLSPCTESRQSILYRYSGTPTMYYIKPGRNPWFRLFPYPGSSGVVTLTYRRSMLPLIHSGRDDMNSAGTVSISGTSVTGIGTKFRQDMAGCVLRVGDGGYVPTDYEGFSPYTEEGLISSVTDETHLTLESAMATVSGASYCITSLLDVDYHVYQLLHGLAVAKLSGMLGRNIPVDTDAVLKRALAADAMQLGAADISGRMAPLYSGRIQYA